MFANLVQACIDFLYPPNCGVCGTPCLPDDQCICSECRPRNTLLPSTHMPSRMCRVCGEAHAVGEQSECYICQMFPLNVDSLQSLWWYDTRSELSIKALKYEYRRELSNYFAHQLGELLLRQHPTPSSHWDILTVVPSTNAALQERGFHHVAAIGRRIAKRFSLSFRPAAILSTKERTPQAGLSPSQRIGNVENDFQVAKKFAKGTKILLLDDVTTSGASLNAASQQLRSAGAASVTAYTLFRSPHFQRNRIASSILRTTQVAA